MLNKIFIHDLERARISPIQATKLLAEVYPYNNLEITELVLKKGANLNIPIGEDDTVLTYVIRKNASTKMIAYLLEEGANPNLATIYSKRTPLFYAIQKGRIDVVKLLLKYKANLNVKDYVGMTPLLYSMLYQKTKNQKKWQQITKLLREYGAKNPYPYGYSPIDVAITFAKAAKKYAAIIGSNECFGFPNFDLLNQQEELAEQQFSRQLKQLQKEKLDLLRKQNLFKSNMKVLRTWGVWNQQELHYQIGDFNINLNFVRQVLRLKNQQLWTNYQSYLASISRILSRQRNIQCGNYNFSYLNERNISNNPNNFVLKGIFSQHLNKRIMVLVHRKGYEIGNGVDMTTPFINWLIELTKLYNSDFFKKGWNLANKDLPNRIYELMITGHTLSQMIVSNDLNTFDKLATSFAYTLIN